MARPQQQSDTSRRGSAVEAVAGTAIAGTTASRKIPEWTNAVVRAKQKQDYRKVKLQLKGTDRRREPNEVNRKTMVPYDKPDTNNGRGISSTGRWVDLKTVDDKPVMGPSVHVGPDGVEHPTKPKAGKSPRLVAYNKGQDARTAARNHYKNSDSVPFSESKWEKDPDTGKKLKYKYDPNLGRKVITGAHMGEMSRRAVLAGGLAVGGAMAWHGARNYAHQSQLKRAKESREIHKGLSRGEVDGGIVGGGLGLAAWHAPSHMEWIGRAGQDKKTAKKPKAKKAIEDWKKEYKVDRAQKGDPRWTEAYRNYPKKLPGSRMRRTMAYTHAGKTGMALQAVPITLGAAAGIGVVRSSKKEHKRKALMEVRSK